MHSDVRSSSKYLKLHVYYVTRIKRVKISFHTFLMNSKNMESQKREPSIFTATEECKLYLKIKKFTIF